MRILLALLLIAHIPVFGQGVGNVDLVGLDHYYQQMARDWDIPSMSIGIVKDGSLIFTGNYGVKEVGAKDAPDSNTLYAIASNSKAFTSAIIAMLVDEGKLAWDDRVRDYLPYFELWDPWVSNEVRVRDLLCHRVGLGTFSGDLIWYKSDFTAEEIIRRIKYLNPAFPFRAGYGYSNLMYITAGELIAEVSGKSWAENVKERILQPLGMSRTVTNLRDLQAMDNVATPHGRKEERNIPIEWVDWEIVGATGGLISSVEDLSKWMVFNLNHGAWNGDKLLSDEARNTLWTPHNPRMVDHTKSNDFGRHFRAYGLGWGLSDYHGNLLVGHTGGYDGMISILQLMPDRDLGIVCLTNGMQAPIWPAVYYALDRFLGIEPVIDWSDRYLKRLHSNKKKDTRVRTIKAARVKGTAPTVSLESITGTYHSDIHGNILVSVKNDQLHIEFEHAPALSATLEHWHYNVFRLMWDEAQAWFDFGLVEFETDANLNVTGMSFNVPNDDIFFEELNAERIGH